MILAAVQLIAMFTFTSGDTVLVVHSPDPAHPVAVQARKGIRTATALMDQFEAQSWGYQGFRLAAGGVDSVTLQIRQALGFTTTITCGKAGCRASVFSVQLWNSNYSYLRPGLLPPSEMRRLAQALYDAAGIGLTDPPSWPYVWREP